MVFFICWFVLLDYVFLIKCLDLFFSFRNFRSNQFSAWVRHYKILDDEKRIVIPACVVSRIRGEFLHTGFKEFINLDVCNTILRTGRPKMFCKKCVPKNLVKLIRKHLCWSLFLTKLQALEQQLYMKKTLAQMFSNEFCNIFKEHLFYRTPPGNSLLLYPALRFFSQISARFFSVFGLGN